MIKKIFVSGCYDMLHSGHVAFFQEAASLGDLYVGLGSDKTVYNLKGRKTILDQFRLRINGFRTGNQGIETRHFLC
jgi:cytidyltransferase-like protein